MTTRITVHNNDECVVSHSCTSGSASAQCHPRTNPNLPTRASHLRKPTMYLRECYMRTGECVAEFRCVFRSQNIQRSGVARICYEEGQSWKFGHRALTADFRAGCSSCSMTFNSFVTNAVLIERIVSWWHVHKLLLQTTQHLYSWQSDLL